MEWDWAFVWQIMPTLLEGVKITILATLLGSVLAAVVGLGIALARRSPNRILSRSVGFVAEFIRGTPLLVQLYFIFYVLPDIGILLPPLVAGVIGLGLHYGTYTAEVYRAGIDNVPRGQWEAAKACNLTAPPDLDAHHPAAGDPADDPGARQLFHRHVQGNAAALGDHRARTDEPGEERRQFELPLHRADHAWSARSSSSSA